MTRMLVLAGLMLVACQVDAAGLNGAEAAEKMRQARLSDGFEARMDVLVTLPDGAHPAPLKLSVIGQMTRERQRVLVRGIAPASVKDRYIVAERVTGGSVRAWRYDAKLKPQAVSPMEGIFGSSLAVWDFFTPWWGWHKQEMLGAGKVRGHDCDKIRSQADQPADKVQYVESCIDSKTGVAFETRQYDARHVLQRESSVVALIRKESGGQAAKKSRVKDGSGKVSAIDVYAGDEEYQVTAETFAVLDRLSADQ